MSGKRIGGALLLVFGLMGSVIGVLLLATTEQFIVEQMWLTLIGMGMTLVGVWLVRTAPAHTGPTAVEEINAPSGTQVSPVQGLVAVVVFVASCWWYFGGGIENKVAADFEAQYRMAVQSGSKMDICVRAGLVAEGYLQAQNSALYQQWKQTERTDCAAAGIEQN